MALVLENGNLAWQRVKEALAAVDASPAAVAAFKGLKSTLAQDYRNPQLKFVAIDATTNGSDGTNADQVVSDSACKVVGIYMKKSTGATEAFSRISDHGSADQAAAKLILSSKTAAEEITYLSPAGHAMATGAVFASDTTYNGTTKSLKVDSSNGFVLVKAA